MRAQLAVALAMLIARKHNVSVVSNDMLDTTDRIDRTEHMWSASYDMPKVKPHEMKREQYKKLVLPKRSRKSKRRK